MRNTILLFAAAVLVATVRAEVPQTVDKHYAVHGHAILEASLADGRIQAHDCGSCHDVHIHLEMNNADRSHYRLQEEQFGDQVRFVVKKDEGHWNWNWHSSGRGPDLTIELPADASATLSSGSGDVSLTGVRGDVSLNSGSGNVSDQGSSGSVRLHTGSGDVLGKELSGNLRADTGSGSVRVFGRFNGLEARTGSGDIEIDAGGPKALASGGDIHTSSGSVRLGLANDAHLNLRLSTGSGSIHTDLSIATHGNSDEDRHSLDGTLNGGGPTLRVSTGSGDIRIHPL